MIYSSFYSIFFHKSHRFYAQFNKKKPVLFVYISENTRAIIKLTGRKVPAADGAEYVKFDVLNMKVSVANAKFRLENLFNGDRTLGEIGNTIINENAQLFLEEMIPGFEKSLSKTFLEIANDILTDVTYDEMFPDI